MAQNGDLFMHRILDGAEAEEVGARSEKELFGGRLRTSHGMTRHEGAAQGARFFMMLRQLPALLRRTVQLGWRADRKTLMVFFVAEVGQGAAATYVLLSINTILASLFMGSTTWEHARSSAPSLLYIGSASTVSAFLRAISTGATNRLGPKVEKLAATDLLRRVVRVELTSLEDPDFRTLVDSAQPGTISAGRMIGHSAAIIGGAVSLLAMGGVLAILHPVLLPLLLFVVIPKGWGAVRNARRSYQFMQSRVEHIRQQQALGRLLTEQHGAAELRVHGAGAYLLAHYESMAAGGEAEQSRISRNATLTELVASAVSGVSTVAAYAILAALLATQHMAMAGAATALLAMRIGTSGLQ
ncbi:hypothetical protein [Streptomyces asiaticus]